MQKDIAMKNRESERRRRMMYLWQVMSNQLCRIFMRHNILVPELEKILRWQSSQVALNEPEFAVRREGGEYVHTHSHAAVVTGLTRQEMSRVMENGDALPVPLDGGDLHRLFRILTAWRTDPDYLDEDGKPVDLPLNGSVRSFHALCRNFRRDTPTRPLADALVRNGNAEWVESGDPDERGKTLRYLHPVVTAEITSEMGMAIITQLCSDYLHSLQVLLNPDEPQVPRFRQGYFNDIDVDRADEAQALILEEIQRFTTRCAEILKPYRAEPGKKTVRLGAGSYSFRGAPLFLDDEPEKPVRATIKKRQS